MKHGREIKNLGLERERLADNQRKVEKNKAEGEILKAPNYTEKGYLSLFVISSVPNSNEFLVVLKTGFQKSGDGYLCLTYTRKRSCENNSRLY